ncbi:MAG: hypothetical protein JNK85_05325 [Verrucomicrobiales bacterium]|nr:hypothetical protein [Verrucomicrobiales bacterium]
MKTNSLKTLRMSSMNQDEMALSQRDKAHLDRNAFRASGPRRTATRCAALGLLFSLFAAVTSLAATPKLAAVGQVGPSASAQTHFVLLTWQPVDGFLLAPAHAIYRKAGAADSESEYERLSIVQETSNLATLTLLMQRAAAAGFAMDQVETAVNAVLGGTVPGPDLAGKLSLALTTNLAAPQEQLLRDALPRLHPPIAMALGRAYLAEVSQAEASTFEIREHDPVTQTDREVVARMTTGVAPIVLPAPGDLSEKVETSPRGHLRVMLRWCTPKDLAHSAAQVAGYNLYRADRGVWTQTQGTPPPATLTPEQFSAALGTGLLVQVNRGPILPESQWGCGGLMDPDSYFVSDDHDSAALLRYENGGVPFESGDEVTYYAAALDHFRRPGALSPGLNVVVCDRMPPLVPRQARVENRPDYDEATHTARQHLVLSWERADPAEVAWYWVYRWNSHDEALRHARNPSISNLLARVANAGAGARMEWVDDGTQQLPTAPEAPALPQDAGRTFWYTVRAEDGGACASKVGRGNLSGPSAPAFGVLRNWEGPQGGGGGLTARCCEVEGSFLPVTGQLGQEVVPVRLERGTNTIRWAELRAVSGQVPHRRFEFPSGTNAVTTAVSITGLAGVQLEARFGSASGQVSPWSKGLVLNPAVPIPLHQWSGTMLCSVGDWPCGPGFLNPVDPGSGAVDGVCGSVEKAPGATEWRVYRRTGRGAPLVLIESGKFPDSAWCDSGQPAAAETLCYYLQQFDQDGNPGAIVSAGCVESLGTESMPRPEITRAMILPTPTQAPSLVPSMVAWFCPPPGVERFEVAFRPPPPGAPEVAWLPVAGAQEAIGMDHGVYRSPRIPAGFGGGGSDFEQGFTLPSGVEYRVKVRAIRTKPGEGGEMEVASGEWSDEVLVSFVQGVADSGPQVPWPARPVPGIHPDFFPVAEFDSLEEIGRVEIGTIPTNRVVFPGTETAPAQVRGDSLAPYLTVPLPLVIYRHEISPGHRGEMTQITPLMTGFLGQVLGPPGNPTIQITDRLVMIKRRNSEPGGPFRIWIRDTQPVTGGKSYKYTLVRHHEDREIHEVLASMTAVVPQ